MASPDETNARRKRRPIPPLDTFASPQGVKARSCDHPGCQREGLYRAPKNRDLTEYYWFCLEHVQAYNKSWNYYQGLREEDIEAAIRHSTVWDRPTWPLGDRCGGANRFQGSPRDPFGVFEEGPDAARDPRQKHTARYREDGPRARAMRVLDLTEPLTLETLKSRYKTLVKRYHPDANGGDRDSEERFKMVNEAYHVLMATLGA